MGRILRNLNSFHLPARDRKQYLRIMAESSLKRYGIMEHFIPEAKENRLRMFINYNRCCYEKASLQRFCENVADCMRRLIG